MTLDELGKEILHQTEQGYKGNVQFLINYKYVLIQRICLDSICDYLESDFPEQDSITPYNSFKDFSGFSFMWSLKIYYSSRIYVTDLDYDLTTEDDELNNIIDFKKLSNDLDKFLNYLI